MIAKKLLHIIRSVIKLTFGNAQFMIIRPQEQNKMSTTILSRCSVSKDLRAKTLNYNRRRHLRGLEVDVTFHYQQRVPHR